MEINILAKIYEDRINNVPSRVHTKFFLIIDLQT